jgi:hypothetical protein
MDFRFEKFGSDHKRTLINKLVAFLCWGLVQTKALTLITVFSVKYFVDISFTFSQVLK